MKRLIASIVFFAALAAPTSALAGRTGGGNGAYVPGPPIVVIDGDCQVTFNREDQIKIFEETEILRKGEGTVAIEKTEAYGSRTINGAQIYVDKLPAVLGAVARFMGTCADTQQRQLLYAAQLKFLENASFADGVGQVLKDSGTALVAGHEIAITVSPMGNMEVIQGRGAEFVGKAKMYAAMPEGAFAGLGSVGVMQGDILLQRDIVAERFANRSNMPFAPYAGPGIGGVPVANPTASSDEVARLKAELAKETKRANDASKALAETVGE